MKNASNLGFIVIILMILGCACPTLDESKDNSSDKKTISNSNSSKMPADEEVASEPPELPKTSSPASSGTNLSLGKYNRIMYGMSYEEVTEIIGFDGKIIKTSPNGTIRYVWGDDFTFIMITFVNDKVEIKSQNNLDK